MALSFVATSPVTPGPTGRTVKGLLTFDSSYPTGGEPYLASLFGLTEVNDIDFGEVASGYAFEHDKANKKIKAREGGASSGTIGNTTAVNNSSAVTGTGAGSAAAPITAGLFTVVDDATPGGNPLYVNANTQFPYLVSDMATATANKVLVGTGATLQLRYSATPATDAVQVYFKKANTDGQRFVADLTALGAPAFLQVPCFSGHNLRVYHDAAANTGAAVTVDDTGSIFLTGNLVGGNVTNTTIGGWSQDTAGAAAVVTVSSLSGTAAAQVQNAHNHSLTGGSAAALPEVANATNMSTVTVEVTVDGN